MSNPQMLVVPARRRCVDSDKSPYIYVIRDRSNLSIEMHLPLVTIVTLIITLPLLENIHRILEALEHTLTHA